MKPHRSIVHLTAVAAFSVLTMAAAPAAVTPIDDGTPHLRRQGAAAQLVVDGQPFLILGGEAHNSSSSSPEYMAPIWDRLVALRLNTVLAGVNWELVEPEEGRFDFRLVDALVTDARAHDLRLVLLWFGSWKNGMSSYAPMWVKRDTRRFPRVRLGNGETPEILSPLSLAAADADARAFGALLEHVREIDSREHTVLMVQVENEVGVLGDSRDRSPAAEAAFAAAVPEQWFDYVKKRGADLVPELRARWEAAGAKTAGSWSQVFGPGPATDELFMAWHYARYVDRVAAAGAAAYPIPLYANAWLNEKDAKPGDYPSGGPLAHVLNIWQAGAPHIALLAPDIYAANFAERCQLFSRSGNPLFIPETNRGVEPLRNLFLAVGAYNAIGYSPFGIDTTLPNPSANTEADNATFAKSYDVLRQMTPLILSHQGTDKVIGFALDKEHPSFATTLGGAQVEISLDEIFGRRAERGHGIVVTVGPDEFVGAGIGFRVVFKPAAGSARIGIGAVDEGEFREGQFVKGRRLNGDEDDQGRAWRFSPWGGPQIQRCMIYRSE